MIIKIDKNTCAEFVSQGITDVNVSIITAGCAGSKISVSPRQEKDGRISTEIHNGIRCWIVPESRELLDGAQIARANGKYYLVSKKIAARCGCGTSFSFEKRQISVDLSKIHRLQNALKMSPEVQKIQKIITQIK